MMKASEWVFDRIKEAFEKVAQDEIEKYRLPAANRCASRRTRRSHNVLLVPALQQFPLGRLRLGENIPSGVAQFVERSTIGSDQTGF